LARDIVPRIQEIAALPVKEIHVMFNNIHHGYGPSNAKNLVDLLRQLDLPVVAPTLDDILEDDSDDQLSFE
jgi:uncharacterized protein YecE (DUF72 family)